MSKIEITHLHDKLNSIQELNSKEHKDISIILSRLDQHQTEINGTIIELKKEVLENKKEILNNKGSIIFAKGTAYAVAFITGIISLLSLTKVFGLW